MTLSVLFYVQHLLGVGHLARASRVARAMHDAGLRVQLVTGGPPVPGFPGPGIPAFALPPVTSAEGFSGLLEPSGAPVDETYRRRRRDLLLDLFARERPDVLLIEAYPFGRRQMRFELDPLLEAARAAPWRPLVAASIRDILQRIRKPERIAETVSTLRKNFDLVLVHGDPDFVPVGETFPATSEIADLVRYTGLVAGPPHSASSDRFDIVVSTGGGAAGAALIGAARQACGLLSPRGWTWCLITGPNIPAAATVLHAGLPAGAVATPFRQDFRALLRRARLSVSQCGYNTAADVLQAGCRAVFVPFAAGGETEQTDRAKALAARGIGTVVAEAALDGATLAGAIERTIDGPAPPAWRPKLDGAAESVRILQEAARAAR